MKHNETEDIIYPEEASFLQFDSDYTDHTTAILDDKNTPHELDMIAIANGDFTDMSVHRKRIPQDKTVVWSGIKLNKGIKIIQYMAPDIPSLTRIVFK